MQGEGDCAKLPETEDEEHLLEVINQRAEFYKKETANMKRVFDKLGIKVEDFRDITKKLVEVQKTLGTESLDTNAVRLAVLERQSEITKQKLASLDLEMASKRLETANTELGGELVQLQNEFDRNDLMEDPAVLIKDKRQLETLERDLKTLQVQNVGIDDNLDLCHLAKEAAVLQTLQEKRAQLEGKIKRYGGLKPNLEKARQQLCDIKRDYTSSMHQQNSKPEKPY